MKESLARREKRQPIPSGLAGRLRGRRAFVWFFVQIFHRFVCCDVRPYTAERSDAACILYGRTSHSHRVIAGHLKVILKSPFRSFCFRSVLFCLSVGACAWLRRPSAKREGDGAASAAPSATPPTCL